MDLERQGSPALAIIVLVVGVPLWLGWEYTRPAWTTGTISGTEVRRTNPDARGNSTDVEYIYMRSRADRGLEFENEDSWWWLNRKAFGRVTRKSLARPRGWRRAVYLA